MSRTFRIRNYDFLYHVMVRSIEDIPLFKDDKDKDKYLYFVKKYEDELDFKVYTYCLMTNHGHLLIDANGADISKVMHGINQSYAQYFNVKYDRHGPVFGDRFRSKVVDSDEYLFILSAYIHNNPTSIEGYKTRPEKYKYSSLGIYLGLENDIFDIVDEEFIMGFFSENVKKAREKYYKFVMKCDDDYMKAHYHFKDEKTEYKSKRFVLERHFKSEDIVRFITRYFNADEKMLKLKYNRKAKEMRALCIFLIRYYCDLSYKDICSITGYLSLTRISELSNIGCQLIKNDERYKNIMEQFSRQSQFVIIK